MLICCPNSIEASEKRLSIVCKSASEWAFKEQSSAKSASWRSSVLVFWFASLILVECHYNSIFKVRRHFLFFSKLWEDIRKMFQGFGACCLEYLSRNVVFSWGFPWVVWFDCFLDFINGGRRIQVFDRWLLCYLVQYFIVNSRWSIQERTEMFSPALEKPFLVLDQGTAIW